MELQSFIGNLKALEINTSKVKGHNYSPIEQVLAYYAVISSSNKDKYDIWVLKNNRINSTNLTTSSMSMMISNMRFMINGSGNSRISEQGKNVANFLLKEFHNKRMDRFKLKELINGAYGENVV